MSDSSQQRLSDQTAAPAAVGEVIVWIPSLLRDLTGNQESVRVNGATVRQIIEKLDQQFPGIKDRLCSEGRLQPGIAVVVDAQISSLGLLQPVGTKSEVHFLPALSGG